MSHVTHTNESCRTHGSFAKNNLCTLVNNSRQNTSGWQRPIKSLDIEVPFCIFATNDWGLLQKRTCKHQVPEVSSPPCVFFPFFLSRSSILALSSSKSLSISLFLPLLQFTIGFASAQMHCSWTCRKERCPSLGRNTLWPQHTATHRNTLRGSPRCSSPARGHVHKRDTRVPIDCGCE